MVWVVFGVVKLISIISGGIIYENTFYGNRVFKCFRGL